MKSSRLHLIYAFAAIVLSVLSARATVQTVPISSITANTPLVFDHKEKYSCKKGGENNGNGGPSGRPAGDGYAPIIEDENRMMRESGSNTHSVKPNPPLAKSEEAESTATFQLNAKPLLIGLNVLANATASAPTIMVEKCPDETAKEYQAREQKFTKDVNDAINAIVQAANAPQHLSKDEINALLKGRTIELDIALPAFFEDQKTLKITVVGKKITDRALGGG